MGPLCGERGTQGSQRCSCLEQAVEREGGRGRERWERQSTDSTIN